MRAAAEWWGCVAGCVAGAPGGFVHLSAMIGEVASAWHWESCYLFYIIKTSNYI